MMHSEQTIEAGRSVYDDVLEAQAFRDFLPTKNGVMVFRLVGHDNAEVQNNFDEIEKHNSIVC